jgi:hypothetical protein
MVFHRHIQSSVSDVWVLNNLYCLCAKIEERFHAKNWNVN